MHSIGLSLTHTYTRKHTHTHTFSISFSSFTYTHTQTHKHTHTQTNVHANYTCPISLLGCLFLLSERALLEHRSQFHHYFMRSFYVHRFYVLSILVSNYQAIENLHKNCSQMLVKLTTEVHFNNLLPQNADELAGNIISCCSVSPTYITLPNFSSKHNQKLFQAFQALCAKRSSINRKSCLCQLN